MSDPTYLALQNQHKWVDETLRSTNNIDYEEIRQEASEMLKVRSNGDRDSFEKFVLLKSKFVCMFDAIKNCDTSRLKEFEEIMNNMLDKLVQVQKGNVNFTDVRTKIFEEDLAHRYFRSN